MNKNLLKVIAFVLLVFAVAFYLGNRETKTSAQSQLNHNVTGQAWSSNVGWISFSCDTDPAGCTQSNGSYGVDIDPNTGNLSGQAWSSNVGWISFPTSCPSGACPAKYDPSTGNISGWARVCGGMYDQSLNQATPNNTCGGSGRTDGWDGWISLSGTPASGAYGAKFASGSGLGSGAAWGSEVVGWIDFSGVKYNVLPPAANLTASPNYFLCDTPPTSIVLNWSTANVTSCTPSSNPASPNWNSSSITIPSGSKTLTTPATPQSYYLTCTGPGGSTGIIPALVSCGTTPPPNPCQTPPQTYQNPSTLLCECPPGTTLDTSVTPNVCKGTKTPPKFEEI